MDKTLSIDDYLVQREMVELTGSLKEVLGKIIEDISSGVSEGKAPLDSSGYYGDYINLVPSDRVGSCKNFLVGICYDKDKFEDRIREWLDHAATKCQEINRELYFFTTQWDSRTINKFKGYIESLRINGIYLNMIYITEKGLVSMPV